MSILSQKFETKNKLYQLFVNPYLTRFVPVNSEVLDVGCNAGELGKILTQEKSCVVYGVDISHEAVAKAKKYLAAAAVMDIENDELPFYKKKFSVVVFGDVLEHLIDPLSVLIRSKQWLVPGGLIIVSLPNVANISIRIKLLLGRWDYQQSGILDDSHLRFYTLKTMKQLFVQAGFKIVAIDSTPGFKFLGVESSLALRNLNERLCKSWPTLLANQFVFMLRRDCDNL